MPKGVQVYTQATAPTGSQVQPGDIWIKPGAPDLVYVCSDASPGITFVLCGTAGTGDVNAILAGAGVTVSNPTGSVTVAAKALVASGASHQAGYAPDPGASGGTTKFLREDASWQVPAYPVTSVNGETGAVIVNVPVTDIVGLTAEQIAVIGSEPPELIPGQPGKILRLLSVASQTIPGSIPFFENNHISISYTDNVTPLTIGTVLVSSGLAGQFSFESCKASIGGSGNEFPLADIIGAGLSASEGSDDANGGLATASIDDGGTGYAPGNTFTIGDNGATGVVDTVLVGAVVTFTITAPGYEYEIGTPVATAATTGVGEGLALTPLTIVPPDGTARLWITYQILDPAT